MSNYHRNDNIWREIINILSLSVRLLKLQAIFTYLNLQRKQDINFYIYKKIEEKVSILEKKALTMLTI